MRRSECHSRRISRPATGRERKVRTRCREQRARRVAVVVASARSSPWRSRPSLVAACGSSATGRAARAGAPAVATTRVAPVAPCGAGDPGAAGPSNEIGVTSDAITIGVVADVTGARASFRSNWEAMQAFAAYCNAQGGIAGRRLVVQLFDPRCSTTARPSPTRAPRCSRSSARRRRSTATAPASRPTAASPTSPRSWPSRRTSGCRPSCSRSRVRSSSTSSGRCGTSPGVDHAAVRRGAIAYLDVGVTAIRTARQVAASRAVGLPLRRQGRPAGPHRTRRLRPHRRRTSSDSGRST